MRERNTRKGEKDSRGKPGKAKRGKGRSGTERRGKEGKGEAREGRERQGERQAMKAQAGEEKERKLKGGKAKAREGKKRKYGSSTCAIHFVLCVDPPTAHHKIRPRLSQGFHPTNLKAWLP